MKVAFCMTAEQAIDYLRSTIWQALSGNSAGKIWISRELREQLEPNPGQFTEYR